MLNELMDFEGVPKEPPKIIPKRPSLKSVSSNSKKEPSEISKEEIEEDPPVIEEKKELTLGEKILLRQKKEENDKKRKAELYKNLHKNKKMNLHQFLSRVQNYEQKKKYNLELRKYQQLQKEAQSVQDKPKLSNNTIRICNTITHEPLYKRTNEVLEEHEKEIKNLTTFYSMPREVRDRYANENKNTIKLNNNKTNRFQNLNKFREKYYSVENTRYNNTDDYSNNLQTYDNSNYNKKMKNKNNKPKKMTKQKSDEFFEKQEKWLKNKKVNNQYFEKFYQIQNDTYSDITFKPYVSQASLEILDIKNRLNTNNDDFYKYRIPNSFSQYNNFLLNKGRTIWDKLYEEAFQEKNCCEDSFIKYNNIKKKDKFKNVSSKYFDIYNQKDNNKVRNKRNINKSTDIKPNHHNKKIKAKIMNKSFDDRSINNNINSNSNIGNIDKKNQNKKRNVFEANDNNENNYYKMKNEKEKFHWRNSLLNIKPLYSEPNDFTYHLNIMQCGAWNDNYVNKVTLNDDTKCKSVINLVNLY